MRVMDPRLVETARTGAMLVLLVLLAWLVARIAWLLIAPTDAVSTLTPRALPTPVSQVSGQAVRADLSLLMKDNPFSASESAAPAIEDAPETDLNLKLVALFMSSGEDGISSATITTPDNKTTRYEPGDEVLPGVVLERVLADRAIISRDGRDETIMRSGRDAGLSVIEDRDDLRTEGGIVEAASPPVFAPGVSARTLLASLEITPEVENGEVRAFVVGPQGNSRLMGAAGLAPGDRLVSVNGNGVASIDVASLADELASGGVARVGLVRAGTSRSIDIRFEEE